MTTMAPTDDLRLRAEHAARRLLEDSVVAMLDQDFDRYRACFAKPYLLASTEAVLTLRSEADFRQLFDTVTARYRALGVTGFDRQIIGILADGPNGLRVAYETRLTCDDVPLGNPHYSYARAQLGEEGWRANETHVTAPVERIPLPDLTDVIERTPPVAIEEAPEAIAQGCLNRLSRAYLDGDFDALLDSLTLPVVMAGEFGTHVFETRESLHRDFQARVTQFRVLAVTDWVRLVKSVTPLWDGRLHVVLHSYLLRGHDLLIPLVRSSAVIRMAHGQWKIETLMQPTGHVTHDRIQAAMGFEPGAPRPA